jgi:hypothetical protein
MTEKAFVEMHSRESGLTILRDSEICRSAITTATWKKFTLRLLQNCNHVGVSLFSISQYFIINIGTVQGISSTIYPNQSTFRLPVLGAYVCSTERLCQPFDERIDHIYKLLKNPDFSSNEVTSVLSDLRTSRHLPPMEVVSPDIWPRHDTITAKTHLKPSFVDSVTLHKNTGRTLSAEDEKYYHPLLTHPSGWSATYPDHMDDS